ncbi:MAG: glycoside hydrolase family 3 protein, partial [Lentisphaeria bacterium]|nr:glycoside hydrolase family 3 protein [Lentisphaeria bacterium]
MDIEKLLSSMTLEEKVGQMCVPILQKGELTEDIEKCITQYNVGMLRYCPNAEYDGNSELVGEPNYYYSPSGMAEFMNSIQQKAKIPLFIAVDQEGSIRNDVNRAGAFAYSGHMSFGAAADYDLTYRVAYATGREFAAMGINLVQAPIVDVLTQSGRKTMKSASFGQDVEKVTQHALAMMKGFKDAGIASMAKHFPGYGSVATDAHKGLAEIVKSFEELDATDIAPMKTLFANGVDGVMTGHVLTHCVDDEYPATMSYKMITEYLRNKLGFDGLVETDAMRMPAIQNKYGTGEASVKAVLAGCDLVLLRGDIKHFEDGYFAILEAAKSGKISEDIINAAVRRILTKKNGIGLLDKPCVDPEAADLIVGCEEHKELADELAERSVTLLKGKDLPLAKGADILTVCAEPQKILA